MLPSIPPPKLMPLPLLAESVSRLFEKGDRVFKSDSNITQAQYDEWSRLVWQWEDACALLNKVGTR